MTSIPSRPDVVVIGAGAAGIAAGRVLADRGIPFVILEARTRIGGRAWTAPLGARSYPLDLGCEWLHSADRNVLAALATSRGRDCDKSTPPWRKRTIQPGFGAADQDDFDAASEAFFARLEAAAAQGPDTVASLQLDPGGRWNGLLDAISTYYNGAPWERISVADFDRYVDTEVNWRIEGGYGAFIAELAADLPIRTGCRVRGIDASGGALRIDTDNGTIVADHAIVTLPTTLLATGAIALARAFDDWTEAAHGLPLGLADKLYFEMERPEAVAPDTRLLGATDRRDCGSYTLRMQGRPLVECYFGGDHARALEAGGLEAFIDAARGELAAGFGRDIVATLKPIVATAWAADPLSQGSYSHALPGHADDRARLRRPIQERVFYAGEATSPHFFSTAHGAWEEGERAAMAVLDARMRVTTPVPAD